MFERFDDFLPFAVLLVSIYFCLPLIQNLLCQQTKGSEKFPYHTKYILTGPEYKFYHALKSFLDPQVYIICPKVGLKDLFEVNAGTKDRQKYFGKISRKHVDFLVCDTQLHPLFAIELDDISHNRADAKERDHIKDVLFKSAGLPLYRVPTASSYSDKYLGKYIQIAPMP